MGKGKKEHEDEEVIEDYNDEVSDEEKNEDEQSDDANDGDDDGDDDESKQQPAGLKSRIGNLKSGVVNFLTGGAAEPATTVAPADVRKQRFEHVFSVNAAARKNDSPPVPVTAKAPERKRPVKEESTSKQTPPKSALKQKSSKSKRRVPTRKHVKKEEPKASAPPKSILKSEAPRDAIPPPPKADSARYEQPPPDETGSEGDDSDSSREINYYGPNSARTSSTADLNAFALPDHPEIVEEDAILPKSKAADGSSVPRSQSAVSNISSQSKKLRGVKRPGKAQRVESPLLANEASKFPMPEASRPMAQASTSQPSRCCFNLF